MHLRPLGNRILAEPLPDPQFSDAGLYLPPIARDQLRAKFKVVALGRGQIYPTKQCGLLRILPDCKPGDVVLANKMAGHPVSVNGKTMRLLDASCLIAVISNV